MKSTFPKTVLLMRYGLLALSFLAIAHQSLYAGFDKNRLHDTMGTRTEKKKIS